jgi:hypothetical protein
MEGNKRRGDNPVPENCKELMTVDQLVALAKLEAFGWTLKYVRRPKFAPVEVILASADGASYAMLREDGELDEKTPVPSRETEIKAPAKVSEADDLQTLADMAGDAPPQGMPMAEPVPSSSNDALPDAEEIPPPKFLV